MKVGFVFMHPFSESMGSVIRLKELALSLAKMGIECYIFDPYEPSFELAPDVHVVSVGDFIGNARMSKLLYKLSKSLYYSRIFPRLFSKIELSSTTFLERIISNMCNQVIKNHIEIIQVEQDAVLPLGVGLKRKTGLPLVSDLHNISSEELVAAGILRRDDNGFCNLQDMSKRLLSETDHTIVVSDSMKDYVVENYDVNSAFVSVVPPGGRLLCDRSIVKKRRDPLKVVYAGLVAYRERVDLFVKSISMVSKHFPEARFFITRKGEAIHDVERLTDELNVNPNFFWYDDYDMVNRFISFCHIGILPSSNDIARRLGTPIKLFNYMSVGLPIVASKIGDWSNVIEKEEVGILVEKNDPDGFASAVSGLLSDESLRQKMSYNAMDAIVERYSWNISAEILAKIYENLD